MCEWEKNDAHIQPCKYLQELLCTMYKDAANILILNAFDDSY